MRTSTAAPSHARRRGEARITAGASWHVTIRALRRWSGHGQHPTIGQGSRTKPVTLGPLILVPDLSRHDRAAAIAALADILTAWWTRQQTAADRPDVQP